MKNTMRFAQGTCMITSASAEARRDRNERNSAEKQLRKYIAEHLDLHDPALQTPDALGKLAGLIPGSQEYLDAAIDHMVSIWKIAC
ncbi:MAG: hypothetical protein IKI57_03525 [Clostridia bacterium]|nr:hypothetical protein [Clostridia bacterium]